MLIKYHEQITRKALKDHVSVPVLETIIQANKKQDGLRYQLGHSHFHFDNNAFNESYAYIREQRELLFSNLKKKQPNNARENFGRLSHTAQDLYAHSNYVDLWLQKNESNSLPDIDSIDPFDDRILDNPELRSGRLYYPLEILSFIPGLGKLLLPLFPGDSHARMNLDGPGSGFRYSYAFSAAVKRTRIEFVGIINALPPGGNVLFTGVGQ
ncbi:hypothetical protein ACFLTX_02335 [Chloroflexota bacterium]